MFNRFVSVRRKRRHCLCVIDAPSARHHDCAICVSREFFMWRPGCRCLTLRYSVTRLIRSTRIPFTLVKTLYG